jgi:hypothetical protein
VGRSKGVRRRQAHAPGFSRALALVSGGDQAINDDDQHHATPFGNSRGGSLVGFELGPCAAVAAHRWDHLEDRAAAW